MSNDGRDPTGPADALPAVYVRLEGAVRRLLDEAAAFRTRAHEAERRVAELERALRDVSSGSLDPMQLRDRLRSYEDENRQLRQRLGRARDRMGRLMARFDFLREEM